MPIAKFARRIFGLQSVFPSSSRTIPSPDSLDGTVSPVYPFPPPPAALDRCARIAVTSTLSTTPDITASPLLTAGQGEWLEILYMSAANGGIQAEQIRTLLTDPASQVVAISEVVVLQTNPRPLMGVGASPTNDLFMPIRVWVPPGWRLDFVGQTAAAAYQFTVAAALIRHTLAEIGVASS